MNSCSPSLNSLIGSLTSWCGGKLAKSERFLLRVFPYASKALDEAWEDNRETSQNTFYFLVDTFFMASSWLTCAPLLDETIKIKRSKWFEITRDRRSCTLQLWVEFNLKNAVSYSGEFPSLTEAIYFLLNLSLVIKPVWYQIGDCNISALKSGKLTSRYDSWRQNE